MLKPLRKKKRYFCSISPPFPYLYREKPTNLEDLSISGINSVSSADKCKLTLDNSEEDSKRIDNMLPVIIHPSLQVPCMAWLHLFSLISYVIFQPFGIGTSLLCVCKTLTVLVWDPQKHFECTSIILYPAASLPAIAAWRKHRSAVPKHRTATIQHLARPRSGGSRRAFWSTA